MTEYNNRTYELPLLPLRGLIVFPYMILHFDVGRKRSIKALEEAMINNQKVFLVAQKDSLSDEPSKEDIYEVGTISKIKQLLKLPGDTIRVLVEGIERAKINQYIYEDPFIMVEVEKVDKEGTLLEDVEIEASIRKLYEVFEQYFQLSTKISPDTLVSIMAIKDPGQIVDVIAANIMIKIEDKQKVLGEFDVKKRIENMIVILTKEIEILGVENAITEKVKGQIEKNQKEYYLREQLKAIQNELGFKDGLSEEIHEYKSKIKRAKLSKEAEEKALKELDRLGKMSSGSAEGSVIRTYVDWLIELPWNRNTKERFDIIKSRKILDNDHYGLEKVKERVLEYLAVRKLTNSLKGPILCFVGPPGVGKTSIAKSIARSLNRKYTRMSLGGVRDEAEIRGHRRTYVGAMPGRIINALKLAGSKNALILLDEIDKMSSDFRGDPSSAMLEVLDSEQNHAFRDHYLEVPFDLSNILFLMTANTLDTVPRPLLDRMEVISISGYTEEEKLEIARRYLIPKQLTNHGLKKSNLRLNEDTVRDIINYYTKESGVRNLEREIANICRKAAKILVENNQKSVSVNLGNLSSFLGIKKYNYHKMNQHDEIGIATGLAWTPVGGDTLPIEVNIMEGNGKIELTGQLGDVMKESAKAAISYIRSRAKEFKLPKDFHNKVDIHIHVPEGAVPKDGPSAGITMATALVSALTGYPVRKDVAMTGEITLRGRVLPIGGLKEKSLGAYRAGIINIIIPFENSKDIEEIPDTIKQKINFTIVENMDEVINTALSKKQKSKGIYELVKGTDKKNEKKMDDNLGHIPKENIEKDVPLIKQ
jgi:ATP-dependent Lon protease